MAFLNLWLVIAFVAAQAEPSLIPQFVIDFDKPASQRYDAVFIHFKEDIAIMEDYFWNSISPELRSFYSTDDNLELYKKANQDTYQAMERLAEIIGIPVVQTVTVNMITEFSTYCTSIVARNERNEIMHVRNLDFGFTTVMKRLVYEAVLTKDGLEKARSPCIAGYYGSYTGHKAGVFSVSYNVRETVRVPTVQMLLANLENTLDPTRVPLENLIQTLLLEDSVTFNQAVQTIMTQKVTSPGYVILGGISGNEGVVIARDSDHTNHTAWLTETDWFVVQTNRDIWRVHDDARYNAAVFHLQTLGQSQVLPNGRAVIEDVLWQKLVLTDLTIFSSTQTAVEPFALYFPPAVAFIQ